MIAINKLKASKSPGIDNVLKGGGNKNRKGSHERAFSTLFNRILDTGKYPALWSFGLIVPIHKKDDRSKVENYRGITLLSAQGKIFTSILNNRLHEYVVQKGILKVSQLGEHISLEICVSQVAERISLGICVSHVGEHISLGIYVSQVGEHISLGICVSQVGEHVSLGICVS